MRFDDGLLKVFRLTNTAEDGMMPVLSESELLTACYSERTVGSSRYYNALQADTQIDMIVRIPRAYGLLSGDRVRLSPYAWEAPDLPFIVVQVQQVLDDDTRLPATDLSLRTMRASEVDDDTVIS